MLDEMRRSYWEFIQTADGKDSNEICQAATRSLGSLEPTKEGIEGFAREIAREAGRYIEAADVRFSKTGYFFSVAINRLEEKKDQEVVLDFREGIATYPPQESISRKMSGFGYKFPRGNLTVIGGDLFNFGGNQIAGTLLLIGDSSGYVNSGQIDGLTTVDGTCAGKAGYRKHGGTTRILKAPTEKQIKSLAKGQTYMMEAGCEATGGLIEAPECGDYAGLRNMGCIIRSSVMGIMVGHEMAAGDIQADRIEKKQLSDKIFGGRIFEKRNGVYVQVWPEGKNENRAYFRSAF